MCGGWDSSLWEEDMDSGDGDGMILADDLDCRSHNSSPVRRRAQQRLTRVRGALNRSCSVPDSNNPPCLSPPSHGDISVPVSDLTEIGADEHLSCKSVWSNRLQRLNRGRSCESYPHSSAEDCANSAVNYQVSEGNEDAPETLFSGETKIQGSRECQSCNCAQDSASSCTFCQELEMEQDSSWDQGSLNHSLYIPNNYMTKSMLCLNEESQDEVRLRGPVRCSCVHWRVGCLWIRVAVEEREWATIRVLSLARLRNGSSWMELVLTWSFVCIVIMRPKNKVSALWKQWVIQRGDRVIIDPTAVLARPALLSLWLARICRFHMIKASLLNIFFWQEKVREALPPIGTFLPLKKQKWQVFNGTGRQLDNRREGAQLGPRPGSIACSWLSSPERGWSVGHTVNYCSHQKGDMI